MTKKKHSWWKRNKRRFIRFLARVFGPWVLRALAWSWRVRRVDNFWENWPKDENRPVFALWHANIPAGVSVYRGWDLMVMASKHHDGQVIARIAEGLGFRTATGSSSEGGRAALKTMLEYAKEPHGLVITPDGPRGPAGSVAPGALFLAAAGKRKLVACGFACSRAWYIEGSWDRMMIPKPFAKVVITFSDGISVARDAIRADEDQQREADRLRDAIQEEMHNAEAQLAEWMQGS